MRLAACDARALLLGLRPGLALADARARVPDLVVWEHDPDADQVLLEWIADGCERYTPLIALDPPDGMILDITGCEHIWEGEAELTADLSQRLNNAGFTSVIIVAETPDKARAFARHGTEDMRTSGDVRNLPVRALDIDSGAVSTLTRAGLRTLGDLACRPRIAFAARLGIAAVTRLDRILGHEDVRLSPRRHEPALFSVRRFAEPVAHNVAIMTALEELIAQTALALYSRAEGGRYFAASLYRSDGNVRKLSIETGVPTRDVRLLCRLFHERIDTLADPLDPGFGYDAIRLDVVRVDPLIAQQKDGLDGAEQAEEVGPLLDQLATRLGSAQVLRFIAGDSHIPEMAFTVQSAQKPVMTLGWPENDAGEPPLRPFCLFDPPQPVEVSAAYAPDGPPLIFRWRRETHRVALAEGPERAAPEWWRRKYGYIPSEGGFTRDYYRVEDNKGRRFWLFRRGLYGEAERPLWYLHGTFA